MIITAKPAMDFDGSAIEVKILRRMMYCTYTAVKGPGRETDLSCKFVVRSLNEGIARLPLTLLWKE